MSNKQLIFIYKALPLSPHLISSLCFAQKAAILLVVLIFSFCKKPYNYLILSSHQLFMHFPKFQSRLSAARSSNSI